MLAHPAYFGWLILTFHFLALFNHFDSIAREPPAFPVAGEVEKLSFIPQVSSMGALNSGRQAGNHLGTTLKVPHRIRWDPVELTTLLPKAKSA